MNGSKIHDSHQTKNKPLILMKLVFVFFKQFYEQLFVVRQCTVHGAFAIYKPQVTIKWLIEMGK